MRTYDSRTYEGAYMAGVIAGKMTARPTLWVLLHRSQFQKLFATSTVLPLGAQSSNPKIKTRSGVGQ
jgi:simple sugar transport system substrate-binding protein